MILHFVKVTLPHLESQPKDDKPGEKRAEPGGFVFDFDEALNLSFQPRTRKIA